MLSGSVVSDIDVSDKGCVKINDVNENLDEKIALHTINSSWHGNARALKIEGYAEVLANHPGGDPPQ